MKTSNIGRRASEYIRAEYGAAWYMLVPALRRAIVSDAVMMMISEQDDTVLANKTAEWMRDKTHEWIADCVKALANAGHSMQ